LKEPQHTLILLNIFSLAKRVPQQRGLKVVMDGHLLLGKKGSCKKSSSATRIERIRVFHLLVGASGLAKRVPQQRGLKDKKAINPYSAGTNPCKKSSSATRIESWLLGCFP